MKVTALLLITLMSLQFAIADEAPVETESRWSCIAYGYDNNGFYRNATSVGHSTEAEAKRVAIARCVSQTLNSCQIQSCHEM